MKLDGLRGSEVSWIGVIETGLTGSTGDCGFLGAARRVLVTSLESVGAPEGAGSCLHFTLPRYCWCLARRPPHLQLSFKGMVPFVRARV